MIKAEGDRYVSSYRIIQDYYRDVTSKPTEPTQQDLPTFKPVKPLESSVQSLTKSWKTNTSSNRIDLSVFFKPPNTKGSSSAANGGQVGLSAVLPRRVSVSLASIRQKPLDSDIPYLEELQQAIEMTTKTVSAVEPTPKDNKKKQATDNAFDTPLEQVQAMEQEAVVLKDRLRRIKNYYLDMVKVS